MRKPICIIKFIICLILTVALSVTSSPLQYTANAATKNTSSKNQIVIKSYSPKAKKSYSAGSKFSVSVTTKTASKVYATFNGKKIKLKIKNQTSNGYSKFTGSFTLPSGNTKAKNLGKIKFRVKYKGKSKTFYSKHITCKKDKNVSLSDVNYVKVKKGVITQIVSYQAETFTGKKNDTSKPYNNYLPQGTLDYGTTKYETLERDGKKLKILTLRCGKKVYKYRYDKPTNKKVTVARQFKGYLPDHNEISVDDFYENSSHTILSLNTLWKAPFDFKLKNQKYNSGFSVDKATYKYIDITFCYATVFDGELQIPENNPLFSKAKLIKNKYDYTLRLYLKEKGAFYGWDAYYDSYGRLCFAFLNPAKITKANNKYGADLTGVKILIDVGHGGIDGGAVGSKNSKKDEAYYNLRLAKKLASELLSTGATVYMTRTTDKTSSTDEKMKILKQLKPNYCIAIHHDHNLRSSLNGMGSYYYYPFSKTAASYVSKQTAKTKIYKKKSFKWHYYFMGRSSVCPVVLTENGYMSNSYDYKKIKNSKITQKKAVALTKGIVQYFKSIQ